MELLGLEDLEEQQVKMEMDLAIKPEAMVGNLLYAQLLSAGLLLVITQIHGIIFPTREEELDKMAAAEEAIGSALEVLAALKEVALVAALELEAVAVALKLALGIQAAREALAKLNYIIKIDRGYTNELD
jgi:hypothetical protein